jgi:hypothetical protein
LTEGFDFVCHGSDGKRGLDSLIGGAVVITVGESLCGRAEVVVGRKLGFVRRRAGRDAEHLKVQWFQLTFAEKAQTVRDCCVRVLGFSGEAGAE